MNASTQKTCSSCGASLSSGAQFCHACGTRQAPERAPLPVGVWGIAAVIGVLVIAIAAYSIGRSSVKPAETPGAPFAGGTPGEPPDISSMSPREQADRLFELVMTAHEQGDFARANQFTPMALQAYGILGPLDPDSHYHIGLMSAISGDVEEVLARADSIVAAVPDHLFALMLRNSVAQLQGDSATSQAAQRRFLQLYDAQIATGREEYQLHSRALDAFRSQALGSTGGS